MVCKKILNYKLEKVLDENITHIFYCCTTRNMTNPRD